MAKAVIKLIYDKKKGSHQVIFDLEQETMRISEHNKNHDRLVDKLTDELIKDGAVVRKEEQKSNISKEEKPEIGKTIRKEVKL